MQPTEAQIAEFKTTMDAHRVKTDALTRDIENATDPKARMKACHALVQHYNCLYPCTHGQNGANPCLACDILYRACYGIPEDDGEGGPLG